MKLIGILFWVLLLLPGCSTYKGKQELFNQSWKAGNLETARSEIAKQSGKAGKGDKLIYQLEEGTVLQVMGKFPESVAVFRKAEKGVEDDENRGSIRLGAEVSGALVNQAARAYEPATYDRIMLKTYLALCLLAAGEFDSASIELLHAYHYQRQAVQDNAKKIEKAAAEAKESKVDVERVLAMPQVQEKMTAIKDSCQSYEGYADYINPFTTLLFTLDLLYNKKDTSNAENFLDRLEKLVPNHPAIAAEWEQLSNLRTGKELSGVTYLIVETGQAPKRDQIRIDIPLFLVSDQIPYIGAAFPILKPDPDFVGDFRLVTSQGSVAATMVADVDRIVQTDFRNSLPSIVTRTIVSSTIKATANAVLQKQTGVVGGLLGAAYQAAVNIADTRCWTTLPKQVHIARIPTPVGGKARVVSDLLHLDKEVDLKPGRLQFIWVRSIGPNTPAFVTQIAMP